MVMKARICQKEGRSYDNDSGNFECYSCSFKL